MQYQDKYLKYKNKYLELKSLEGGALSDHTLIFLSSPDSNEFY